MSEVTVRSCAKINLGLNVFGRRDDGYHEINTTLQTIDLNDRILFRDADTLSLQVEGDTSIPADETNLVLRAAGLLQEAAPGRGASITLTKAIPSGAGLGGGSSNAAATLMALDRLWALRSEPGHLYRLARSLGSDVPFFLYGGTCLGVGRGDEVIPLPDLPCRRVLVVWPGLALSTTEVYSGLSGALTRRRIPSNMRRFAPEKVSGVPGEAVAAPAGREADREAPDMLPRVDNDLEATSFRLVPRLRQIKERLLESGATAAAMSGSGSAVYGLFPESFPVEPLVAKLTQGKEVAFSCRTLTRDRYRLELFERSKDLT